MIVTIDQALNKFIINAYICLKTNSECKAIFAQVNSPKQCRNNMKLRVVN